MTASVRVTVLDTGYCTVHSNLVARGTGWHPVRCHAPAFLLQHPTQGVLLFDTGYAPRLLDAFARWPDRLYSYATPTTLGVPVVAQLAGLGIAARDVGTVIVSHLHADHVAGVRDFPAAAFVLSAAALELQQHSRRLNAVRRGVLQCLFPDDFAARARVVAAFEDTPLPALGRTHDLFGDGSVRLVPLPGHARGQIGALVQTARRDVLLCADGAWTSLAYRAIRPPHWITSAIQDDTRALLSTLRRLHAFADARPDTVILPTHCPETLRWVPDA